MNNTNLSKIANFFAIVPIVVFLLCLMLKGLNLEFENEVQIAKWISYSMIISTIISFLIVIISDPDRPAEKCGWQIVSIMPLIGYVLFLFNIFA